MMSMFIVYIKKTRQPKRQTHWNKWWSKGIAGIKNLITLYSWFIILYNVASVL